MGWEVGSVLGAWSLLPKLNLTGFESMSSPLAGVFSDLGTSGLSFSSVKWGP